MGEPKDITEITLREIRYSICTFVTRHSQYKDMVESFVKFMGFHMMSANTCISTIHRQIVLRPLQINKFLTIARGLYIVFCHQDLLLLQDDRKKLDAALEDLDQLDPNWGVCGNGAAFIRGASRLERYPNGLNRLGDCQIS